MAENIYNCTGFEANLLMTSHFPLFIINLKPYLSMESVVLKMVPWMECLKNGSPSVNRWTPSVFHILCYEPDLSTDICSQKMILCKLNDAMAALALSMWRLYLCRSMPIVYLPGWRWNNWHSTMTLQPRSFNFGIIRMQRLSMNTLDGCWHKSLLPICSMAICWKSRVMQSNVESILGIVALP